MLTARDGEALAQAADKARLLGRKAAKAAIHAADLAATRLGIHLGTGIIA